MWKLRAHWTSYRITVLRQRSTHQSQGERESAFSLFSFARQGLFTALRFFFILHEALTQPGLPPATALKNFVPHKQDMLNLTTSSVEYWIDARLVVCFVSWKVTAFATCTVRQQYESCQWVPTPSSSGLIPSSFYTEPTWLRYKLESWSVGRNVLRCENKISLMSM